MPGTDGIAPLCAERQITAVAARGAEKGGSGTIAAMPLSVVILAAGQGKRMASDLPKVLQPLAGRPLLAHVVATARALKPAAIHVVYGHGGERVRAAFAGADIHWALQAEQKGTGHALMQAMPGVPDGHSLLVLYGDVPLIRAGTLAGPRRARGPGCARAAVGAAAGPRRLRSRGSRRRGPRRAHRRGEGREPRGARDRRRSTPACSPRRRRSCARWLGALKADNAQGEYYLTDCIGAAVRDGCAVEAVVADTPSEVLGVNDKVQLAEAEAAHRRSRAEELMRAGVTVVDPARLDVRGEVTCGRDVVLDINVILVGQREDRRPREGRRGLRARRLRDRRRQRGARQFARSRARSRAAGCVIGPFARLRPGTRLADGVHVGNFVEVKNSDARRRQQGEPPDLPRRHDGRERASTSARAPSPATTTA